MNISIKDVRKNAARLLINPLILFFEIAGVLLILTLSIIPSFTNLDLQKNIWPIVLLAVIVFGAFIIIPIVYFIAKNNKKIQIRYIKDIIETKYNYAKVLRMYSEEFAKKVHELAEEKFSDITETFGQSIDYTEEQWQTVERDVMEKLKLSWLKVKKLIDETPDKDAKDDLKESYREPKAEMLEHLKGIKLLFESKKNLAIDEFQQKVSVFINARETMITKNARRNESSAQHQEAVAKTWEIFLKQNYN